MAEDLGTLQIGISADVTALDEQLRVAQQKVQNFKIPEREIPIRVRISTPTEAAITKAQNQIAKTLEKAQKTSVSLTPTLSVKNANIKDFRNEVQRLVSGQKAVEIPFTAKVNGEALRKQILEELGEPVDIPLTWHWAGEPPPGSGPFEVPITPGGPTGGTPSAPVKPPPTKGTTVAPVIGEAKAVGAKQTGQKTIATPVATAAPKEAKIGATATPVATATPTAPPKIGAAAAPTAGPAPTIGQAKAPITQATPEEILDQQVIEVINKLQRGTGDAMAALKQLGGTITSGAEGGVKIRARSRLAAFVKSRPDLEPGKVQEAITAAIRVGEEAAEHVVERSPSDIRGSARSLAGAIPTSNPLDRDRVIQDIMHQAQARKAEFAARPDVQAFKAAFKEHGFAAFTGADLYKNPQTEETASIGSNLVRAQQLLETDPNEAQRLAKETLSIFFSLFPKQAGKLFPNDPGGSRGAKLTPASKPRGIKIEEPTKRNAAGEEVANPKYDVAKEAIAASINSIFFGARTKKQPSRDAAEKAQRLADLRARSTPVETPPSTATSRAGVPGEADILQAIRGGAEPEAAARTVFSGLVKKPKKGQFETFFGGLDQAAIQSAIASREATLPPGEKLKREIIKGFSAETKTRPKVLEADKPVIEDPVLRAQAERDEEREKTKARVAGIKDKIKGHLGPGTSPQDLSSTFQSLLQKHGSIDAVEKAVDSIIKLPRRRAMGGSVPIKPGGLLGRLAAKGIPIPEGATLVGEGGEELLVPGEGGQGHIIDNKAQNLPVWMRRAKERKEGLAKDLTHREGGGGVQSTGLLARKGQFVGADIAKAEADFRRTNLPVQGGVQRVYVVNWPSALGAGAARQAPVGAAAAGGFNFQQLANLLNVAGGGGGGGGGGRGKGKGGGGGGGGGGGAPASRTGFSPLEEAQLEANRQDLITAQRLRQKEIAARISAAIREAPTRGLQTATGEISAINLGGLRGVIERRRLADEAQTRAGVALGAYAKQQEKVDRATIKLAQNQDPKKVQGLTKALQEQTEALDFTEKRYEGLAQTAEKLGKEVITTKDKLKVFASNTGGIIAGTLLFGTTLGIAQAALGGIGQAIGPLLERLTGFTATSARVTSALSDQALSAGGDVKAVVALANANAGLSSSVSDTISPLLEQRASTEAGNKNLQTALDLFHTFEQAQAGGGQQGLFGTTGGFLGTPLFGVPSTQESVAKEFTQNFVPQADIEALRARQSGAKTVTQPARPGDLQFQFGENGPTPIQTTTTTTQALGELSDSAKLLDGRMNFFNGQLEKGGSSLHFMIAQTDDAAKSFAVAAENAGATEFSRAAIQNKVILANAQNQPVLDEKQIRGGVSAINVAEQTPDAGELIKQLTSRIIPNQLAAFEAEAQLQLQQTIPAQRGLEFLNAPPAPFGTGLTQQAQGTTGATPFGPGAPSQIGGFGTVDQAAISSFNIYKGVATSAMNAVIAKAKEGKQALMDMGVPPELIAEMETLGQQAEGIQLGLSNRQAALEAAQYNHQLFQLNRSLADALALTGKQVGAQGALGKLERQNFELSKQQNALQLQSQVLSLNLTQRQINFQRALAGFQAPGETGEERAARIEEAKIEADYAQKQLDIQKQLLGLGQKQFHIGVQIFDESARRQVEDLRFALSELKQSHSLSLDGKAAEQTLALIRARQAQINSEIGVQIEKSTKKATLAINSALEIANKSGEAFNKILVQTARAWGIFATQGVNAIVDFLQPKHPGSPNPAHGQASGIIGSTQGTTSLTVGEAGTETVAVLRNPRNLDLRSLTGVQPTGGGGSGVTIVVDVHDNKINSDNEDALVSKIARAVESSMQRKTSLLGLRTS